MTKSRLINKTVKMGKNVVIGNNVTFYGKVTIGDNTQIFDGAVIGRPPKATANINRQPTGLKNKISIGKGCIIGANAVLYTDIKIGDNVLIGDLTTIREGCSFANEVVIGRGVLVMYDTHVGKRSRIIDGCILTGEMTIEEDVFFGPGVNSINDNAPYLSRFGLSDLEIKGPTIRSFVLVGAGANLNGDIEVGIGAIVAPNAMVTKSVNPWSIVAGIPAKEIKKVDKQDIEKLKKHFKIK